MKNRRNSRRPAWTGDLDARLDLIKAAARQPSPPTADENATANIMWIADGLTAQRRDRKVRLLRLGANLPLFAAMVIVIHWSVTGASLIAAATPLLHIALHSLLTRPLSGGREELSRAKQTERQG